MGQVVRMSSFGNLFRPGFSMPKRTRLEFALDSYWQICGIRDAEQFFSKADMFLRNSDFLFFEGGAHPKHFRQWLEDSAVDPRYSLRHATMFLRPYTAHIQAKAENLKRLADFASQMASPEICDHLHAYSDGRFVFAWFDAFTDPILLPMDTPESIVSAFSGAVGARYEAIKRTA